MHKPWRPSKRSVHGHDRCPRPSEEDFDQCYTRDSAVDPTYVIRDGDRDVSRSEVVKRDFELLHSVRGKYVSKTFVAPGTGAFEPFFGWTDTVVRKIRRSDVHASIKPILRTIFHDGAHDRCWGHVYHTRACLTLAGGAGDWESHMRSPDPCRGRRRLGITHALA